MVTTDKQGNRYYDAKEAMGVLGVKRSTLIRMVAEAKIRKYHRGAGDRRQVFYRVEDIEGLKDRPVDMVPEDDGRPGVLVSTSR